MSTNNLAQDLLRNMTDRQLQEVLSAISTAANQATQSSQQMAPAPQRKSAVTQGSTPSFSWQSTLPIEPGKQRKSATKTAPAKPVHGQNQSHEQNSVTTRYLSTYSKAAIPASSQAMQTTYASRLRTGCTVMMQPVLPSSLSLNPRAAARRAGLINYADPPSGDELDAEPDTDDSDFNTNKASSRISSFRVKGASGYSTPQGVGTPTLNAQLPGLIASGKQDLDQSYLGMVPPNKFLQAKPAAPTRYEYFPQSSLEEQASKPTNLIPIRVELDTDTHRIRDCFLWNLNEDLITPQQFARIFCADLELPTQPFVQQVTAAIRSQVEEHEGIVSLDLISESDPTSENQPGKPILEEKIECRVILALDVQIGNYQLVDTIEWDLASDLTPEVFAKTLCADLGLAGDSAPVIAHAVYEEILRHKRDAVEWGIIGGDQEEVTLGHEGRFATPGDGAEKDRSRDKSGAGLFKDKTGLGLNAAGFAGRAGRDSAGRGPKRLRGIWKDWTEAEDWSTRLEELSTEEIERREIERERASRRLRRETSKFQSATSVRRRR